MTVVNTTKNQQTLEELAKERAASPITSRKDVGLRLKMRPTSAEVKAMLGDGVEAVEFRAGIGYELTISEGRIHPNIKFSLPNSQWIFDENGNWLNQLTPCIMRKDDQRVRELFPYMTGFAHDIMVIPVEDGGTFEYYPKYHWKSSNVTVTRVSNDGISCFTNALFCIMRLPLEEAEAAKESCGGYGAFYYVDGDEAVLTWLRPWPCPKKTKASSNLKESLWQNRQAQERLLYETSYTKKYDETLESWIQRAREWPSKQIEQSRELFKADDMYKMAEQAGYSLDLSGQQAVLRRELVKLSGRHRRPTRKTLFTKEFPLSPEGLELVKTFLLLVAKVEELSNSALAEVAKLAEEGEVMIKL